MGYSYYEPEFEELLPHRRDDVHKGECGRVGVFAGSLPMLGAGILSAYGAYRVGCGVVVMMSVSEACGVVNVQYPEIIVHPLPSTGGYVDAEASQSVVSLAVDHRMDVMVVGPGLGRHEGVKTSVKDVLKRLSSLVSIVLDADGLHAVTVATIKSCASDMVLTPHAGEFERLFGEPVPLDLKGREKVCVKASQQTGKVVVLKGAQTVVAFGSQVYVNDTGNSGMATAGAGDVLSGVIASFISQGVGVFDSAILGVYLHGLAGDMASDEYGMGLMASDIVEFLPEALMYLSDPDTDDEDDDDDGMINLGMLPHELN